MEADKYKRLAIIKFFYTEGIKQTQFPEPTNCISLLTFHDSIELFLQFSVEYLNIDKKINELMDYWSYINQKIQPNTLSQKSSIRRLNKARVGLKHHGIFPSKTDLETFKIITQNFFEENTPIIFNIDFDDISLFNLISNRNAKSEIKNAEENYKKGEIKTSLKNLASSFEYLLYDYEQSKKDMHFKQPFNFGRSYIFSRTKISSYFHDRPDLNRYFTELIENIDNMRKALKIISFGIDFKKYVKFKSLTPEVYNSDNGPFASEPMLDKLDSNDFNFCKNFIIETALKLQEFDFDIFDKEYYG